MYGREFNIIPDAAQIVTSQRLPKIRKYHELFYKRLIIELFDMKLEGRSVKGRTQTLRCYRGKVKLIHF